MVSGLGAILWWCQWGRCALSEWSVAERVKQHRPGQRRCHGDDGWGPWWLVGRRGSTRGQGRARGRQAECSISSQSVDHSWQFWHHHYTEVSSPSTPTCQSKHAPHPTASLALIPSCHAGQMRLVGRQTRAGQSDLIQCQFDCGWLPGGGCREERWGGSSYHRQHVTAWLNYHSTVCLWLVVDPNTLLALATTHNHGLPVTTTTHYYYYHYYGWARQPTNLSVWPPIHALISSVGRAAGTAGRLGCASLSIWHHPCHQWPLMGLLLSLFSLTTLSLFTDHLYLPSI